MASEVRSLAQRSADAAKEIKSLITASVQRVEQGTAQVDRAGATMTEFVGAIRRMTDIMGDISAASAEQSDGVGQVSEAVTQMDQATQQNAALVEESAAAASSLRSQAEQLVATVAVFQLIRSAQQGGGLRSSAAPHPVAAAPAPVARTVAPARLAMAAVAKPVERKTVTASATAAGPAPAAARTVEKLSPPAAKPTGVPASAAAAPRTAAAGSEDGRETF